MPRPQMPQILGTDTSLDRKRNLGMLGCGFRNAVSEACGQGWHLLSQVLLAGGPFLSPAHCPMRGGWEGSQRSFPLTQQPFEELPWAGHLHVALASLQANLHATPHSQGIVHRQERGTVVQTMSWVAPIWPGIQLSWVSSVLCSASIPPWRTVARTPDRGPPQTHDLAHALATRRDAVSFFPLL